MDLKIYHAAELQSNTKKVFDNIYRGGGIRTSLKEADYILYPEKCTNHHNQNMEWLCNISKVSEAINKPYIAFLPDDPPESMKPYTDNGILFRTSFYKTLSSPNEYCLPSFDRYADRAFNPLSESKPIVGFCGATTHPYRYHAIDALNNCINIEKKFIIRHQFHGHAPQEEMKAREIEFLGNIHDSQYQLCVRGAGNFSHRFYETMMYGRIPVVIDSDMPLPFSGIIDWEQYIVLSKTAHELPDKLLAFHNSHDMLKAQNDCRSLWEEYLSPEGFAKHITKILIDRK